MDETEGLPIVIGRNIRAWRKSSDMSVKYLADAVGTHRNTIANYESGKTEPTSNNLVRIASSLGCTINDLLAVNPRPIPRWSNQFCVSTHDVFFDNS